LSRTQSSVVFDDVQEKKLASILEVDFSAAIKNASINDSISLNFATAAEKVVQVGGRITVSF